jgi:hypothetical protein
LRCVRLDSARGVRSCSGGADRTVSNHTSTRPAFSDRSARGIRCEIEQQSGVSVSGEWVNCRGTGEWCNLATGYAFYIHESKR